MQVEQINQYKHEIEVLTTTVTAETSSLKQCRHLVTELQTTNQELVSRLKVKGRELSQVEGVQKRKDENATVRTQSLEDQVREVCMIHVWYMLVVLVVYLPVPATIWKYTLGSLGLLNLYEDIFLNFYLMFEYNDE